MERSFFVKKRKFRKSIIRISVNKRNYLNTLLINQLERLGIYEINSDLFVKYRTKHWFE